MSLAPQYPWEQPETGAPAKHGAALRAHIPVLRTDRLILRAPCLGDFPAFAEIEMSPRARFMGGPFNREDCWFDFAQSIANWLLNGYGMWTVTTDQQTPQGFVSLMRGYEDLEPELGYFFREPACNRGFATEAARAVRDFAITETGIASMVSYIHPENAASINVAHKLNAIRDAAVEASFKGTENEGDLVFRHWPRRASAHG